MAEIMLSGGALIKTTETVAELRPRLIPDKKFVLIKDSDGKEYDINPKHIVYLVDN